MKVIAVVGQKGGSGKTMTSENISALATKAGLKVLVVDLDPQTNVCLWSDRRESDAPMVVSAQVGRLSHVLKVAEAEGADMAILDTPPKATEVSTAAARAADLVLIITKPYINDLETLPAMRDILMLAGRARSAVVINQAPVRGNRHVFAKAYAEKVGLSVCPVVLHHYVDYADAPVPGLAVSEFEPLGKATEEFNKLYQFALEQLNMQTVEQVN